MFVNKQDIFNARTHVEKRDAVCSSVLTLAAMVPRLYMVIALVITYTGNIEVRQVKLITSQQVPGWHVRPCLTRKKTVLVKVVLQVHICITIDKNLNPSCSPTLQTVCYPFRVLF